MISMLAMVEINGCILNFAVKQPAMVVKHGTQKNTHHQSKDILRRNGKSCKIKNMSEHRTGVDALVHDDGSGGHAHTHHTSDGQVRTCQEDQSRNAQSQEHSGRSLLEDVQHVIVGQKRRPFYHRRDNTQHNEHKDNGNIQTVFQKELPAVKGIFVVFPFLGSLLSIKVNLDMRSISIR